MKLKLYSIPFSRDCKTHGRNLSSNWNIFKSLVVNAKQVIMMDALYSKTTDNVIEGFIDEIQGSPSKKSIITTPKREQDCFLREYESSKRWLNEIFIRLKENKKLSIF